MNSEVFKSASSFVDGKDFWLGISDLPRKDGLYHYERLKDISTHNFSTPSFNSRLCENISTTDFSTPDFSTPDFSTMNFPTPDFSTP